MTFFVTLPAITTCFDTAAAEACGSSAELGERPTVLEAWCRAARSSSERLVLDADAGDRKTLRARRLGEEDREPPAAGQEPIISGAGSPDRTAGPDRPWISRRGARARGDFVAIDRSRVTESRLRSLSDGSTRRQIGLVRHDTLLPGRSPDQPPWPVRNPSGLPEDRLRSASGSQPCGARSVAACIDTRP